MKCLICPKEDVRVHIEVTCKYRGESVEQAYDCYGRGMR